MTRGLLEALVPKALAACADPASPACPLVFHTLPVCGELFPSRLPGLGQGQQDRPRGRSPLHVPSWRRRPGQQLRAVAGSMEVGWDPGGMAPCAWADGTQTRPHSRHLLREVLSSRDGFSVSRDPRFLSGLLHTVPSPPLTGPAGPWLSSPHLHMLGAMPWQVCHVTARLSFWRFPVSPEAQPSLPRPPAPHASPPLPALRLLPRAGL